MGDLRIGIARQFEERALAVTCCDKALMANMTDSNDGVFHPLFQRGMFAFDALRESLRIFAFGGGHNDRYDFFSAAKVQIISQNRIHFLKKLLY